MLELYIANHLRRLEEEPELGAELKRLQRKKSGPKGKWGLPQKAALIIEVESCLPRRGGSLMLDDPSAVSICKKLSRQTHWKLFLDKTQDRAETLRQTYSVCRANKQLRRIARILMSLDASRRVSFVMNVLAPFEGRQGHKRSVEKQSAGLQLQQAWGGVVANKS